MSVSIVFSPLLAADRYSSAHARDTAALIVVDYGCLGDRLWRLPRLTPVLPFSRRHPQAFRQIGNKTRRAGKSAPLTEAAREKGDSQVADESETYTKLGSSRFSSFSHRTEDALATYLHTMEKPFTASQKTDTCCGDTLTRTYDEDPKPSITFIVQMSIGLERLTVGGTDQRLWS